MATKYVQMSDGVLQSAIDTVATTAVFTEFIDLAGVPLVQTDFGDFGYATLEPNTSREESVRFVITANTTGTATVTLTRGLRGKAPYGTGGTAFTHNGGAKLVISNTPDFLNQFTAKDNAETVTSQWSFPTPTNVSSPATKQYADGLVSLGAPEATAITRGISILSASPNVTIGAATISIATPAVISFTAHGLISGDSIQFTTTGALPTGLTASTNYFVMTAGLTANLFQVSATLGGVAINTSGTQSGTQTLIEVTPIAVGFNDTTKLPTVSEKLALAGGGAFGTPGSGNKFLTENYNIGLFKNFGDGSDGSVTISGPTTLIRDMYYQNLTVNSTLDTDGYRIFVKGTLSSTGTINNNNTTTAGNGSPNSGNSAGAGGGGGAIKGSGPLKGRAGVAGGSGSANGNSGNTGTMSVTGSVGGAGGNGNLGVGGIGGGIVTGAAGGPGGVNTFIQKLVDIFSVLFFLYNTGVTFVLHNLTSGGGGGGGAGGYASTSSGGAGGGGGSGGSGGIVLIFAYTISGTVNISSTGGNGGNGGSTSQGGGGGGGGAGGTGGTVVLVYADKSAWTGTYVLTGGTGGTGGTNGSGGGTNGATGSVGSTGASYEFNIKTLL